MADAFISYRRKPSAPLALLLQEKLKNRHSIDAYVDTTRADSTHVQFPERLMQAIADTPTFICLLGDTTLDSEWVGKEIQRAYELRKSCIPIFQESYTPPSNPNPAIEYLLSFDGVHIFDVKNVYVDEAVAQIAALVQRPKASQRRGLFTVVGIGIGALVLIGLMAVIVPGLFNTSQSSLTPPPTTAVAAQITATPTDAAVFVAQTPTDKTEPTQAVVPSTTPTATTNFQATQDAAATAQIHLQTATAAARIAEPGPTRTPIPTKTLAPTIAPIQLASTLVFSNADWIPVTQDFDGVPMVLVPAGCFEMGNDAEGYYPNSIGNLVPGVADGGIQCFEQPFWLDQYEVTNAQFQQSGIIATAESHWQESNRPREQVTWFEAFTLCDQRSARLPTEAEWEYAARGSDNLAYPWGNDWNPDNLVWDKNSNNQTATIGSKPEGRSWVGALDLSGNVAEWVSSLYQPYPYRQNDGREDLYAPGVRVLRGGSWGNSFANNFRASSRNRGNPDKGSPSLGFRCARDIP